MDLGRRTRRTAAFAAAALLVMAALALPAGCASRPTGPTGKTDQGTSTMDRLYAQVRDDFDVIKAGDAVEMYEDTAASLQASKSATDFAASVAVLPIYTKWTKLAIEGDKTHTVGTAKPGTEGAIVALTVDLSTGSGAPYKFDVQYVFEKAKWRLSSLVPSAGMQQN